MKIVSVSGVDGSGKSTFLRELHNHLSTEHPNVRVGTAWLRFNPRAAMSSRAERTAVSTVDEEHRGHSAKRIAMRLGLSKLWMSANTAMYAWQLAWQLSSRNDLDVLLVDRFVLDFLADNIGAGALRESDAARIASRLPDADAGFVLHVSDHNLSLRRHPRESLDALRARRDLYTSLSRTFGVKVVDTTAVNWRAEVTAELERRGVL